jgi:outer membrane receptor protein involved in Fe transport
MATNAHRESISIACRKIAISWLGFMLLAPGLAWSQVEEIVVTARKKTENLQDVPLSVKAFDANTIQRQGIRNVTDIAKYTTSIQFDESFAQSDTRIAVRGLSPTRGRQNIALLVDGIDVSSESITSSGGSLLINTRLIDIERIEVVLGPQMALYGRSAFNGALQYITRDPADEFETELKADINDNQGYELVGAVSGPIFGDALGYRLNATWWDQEGFYDNSVTGASIGGNEGWGLAFTLKSDIGDNFSLKFRTEYTDDSSQPAAQAFLPFNAELNTPAGAVLAGIAGCNSALVDALSDWDDPNNPNQGIDGNNEAWLNRGLRILDPAYVATLDPATLDPDLPSFEIPAGGGSYCEERTPARVGEIPDAGDLAVTLAPDPSTPGIDYVGTERELLRLSLIAEWATDNFALTSLTGYTSDDNTETQDINAFAFRDPDAGPFLDGNVNSFSFNNAKTTQQFSQDIRFSTTFDAPVNGTIGALYWTEDVDNDSKSITGETSGTHCFWNSLTGTLNPVAAPNGCTGYTETPIAPYQDGAAPFRPPSPANRETDHWSIYGNLDFDLAENWTLSFEGRYNNEDVRVEGPIFFDPGASGGPGGLNPCGIFFRPCEPFEDYLAAGNFYDDAYFPWVDEDENGNTVPFLRLDEDLIDDIPIQCWQQKTNAILTSIQDGPAEVETTGTQTPVTAPDGTVYMVDTPVLGSGGQAEKQLDADGRAIPNPNATNYFNPWCNDSLTDSDEWFSPKVALEWRATDDILVYGSWSKAQKPGGFSLLTVGSSGLNRELTEFEPETMEVWEAGANTAWLEDTLVVNGTLFFQDFTDKQALTSTLGNDGRLVSKIENAGSAEVWGAELRVDWSPISDFLRGNWRLSGSYTWLDATYTDFVVQTGSPVTAANAGNCIPTLVGDETLCSVSYTGNKLENSPDGAFSGLVGYYYQMAAGNTAYVETDVIWQDKRFTGITNNLWTASYALVNLRLGFRSDRWETLFYVNNVMDNDTVQFGGGGPGLGCCFALGSEIDIASTPPTTVMVDLPLYSTAFLPRPRVVGVRMSFQFGN